ncbi:uncharacterized protein CTRU02_204465 [Colletotrichum truncatum]|uniref:Uncharacterized protein n=1 Tax=Colletotrichum truncatum TaxID=5467 RepID=A0ACC3ZC58_COLTU|nr:uncharacterized protein CTRU02_02694 [Colletotrichum truncatum]KAF6797652.1 hypothetical protein CTRU02_02694 [Colletotrichum truncatum]
MLPQQISRTFRNAGCLERALPVSRLKLELNPTVPSLRRPHATGQGSHQSAGLLIRPSRGLHSTSYFNNTADDMTLSNGLPRSKASKAHATAHVKEVITPELLERLRRFWFKHLNSEEAFILPQKNQLGRWFFSDADFDEACVRKFRPALEAIKSARATAKDIIAIVRPITPLQWLSLVLLLDQIPRNCYRGAESSVVFKVFDPIALEIANHALKAGAATHSRTKYRVAYRMWFYLPLMHSEDLALHDLAVEHYQEMKQDFEELMAADGAAGDDDQRKCWGVLAVQKETARDLLETNYDFEIKHRDIIAQFGRYPHRNYVMHRESTPEEEKYLRTGGETFSGGR